MTLSQKIVDAVESLSPDVSVPCRINADAGSTRLTLNLTTHGTVGLAFDRLVYEQLDHPGLSVEALRNWGNRLAARVTYLMEPLVVLEVDADAGEAELRSQTPTPRGDRRSFYQVQLHRDASLLFQRVAFNETSRLREVVPCQMTLEVLERLTGDIVASLA